jgi:ATP-dependent Lon protease
LTEEKASPKPAAASGGSILEIKLPKVLPVLPLRSTVLFPMSMTPLTIGRTGSVKLVDEAMAGDRIIAVVAQKSSEVQKPGPDDLYPVGTAALILRMVRLPDSNLNILVQGLQRIRVGTVVQTDPYIKVETEAVPDEPEEYSLESEALLKNLVSQFQKVVALSPQLPDELAITALNIPEPGRLADFVASTLNLSTEERQALLGMNSARRRLSRLTELLARELQVLELGSHIQEKVSKEMDKQQREFFLRQQLEAIRKELGEEDEGARELKELKEKLDKAQLPPEARKESDRELGRLASIPPASPEHGMIVTYLEWMASLPWNTLAGGRIDIGRAREVLDQDHYDLEKVKDRILEYLAVRKFRQDMRGPILCFVGPPGTGKTSLGRSIARSIGRNFQRLSLGGVRDEADIRGHRRTYIGALPGRIIQALRRAGSRNPLIMLDEVDKLGADFRGDPASALLEVLDPEQNGTFTDHYLDVPFDLSAVMFITTANLLDPIPPALRDRMEVLELSGYTEEEKLQIARRHIMPKLIRENGLESLGLTVPDEALIKVIRDYTREAGLRNLERELGSVLRKAARKAAEGEPFTKQLTPQVVRELLGPETWLRSPAEAITEPGIAVGLAWTAAGGDILFIEATRMPGKRGLQLTGQLGDVMKESALAALSWVRTHALELGIAPDFYDEADLHIHLPEGAIPKDGPSAGLTLATALVSLLTGRRARPDTAMTGEITLRGRILPVGGIKEKALAARRAHLRNVVLPEGNRKDLEDLPPDARRDLRFHFVDRLRDALEIVLEPARSGAAAAVGERPAPAAAGAGAGADGRARGVLRKKRPGAPASPGRRARGGRVATSARPRRS